MRFVMITGMSGAGKTQVMHVLEDMGYYCIDNMPLVFLVPFAKMCFKETNKFENVAIVVDIRGGDMVDEIGGALKELDQQNFPYEILFLEARESILVKRYKETRRKHPLSLNGTIEDGIMRERERLAYLRGQATHIIDTSRLLTRELKQIILDIYGETEENYFRIQVESFGFKYGIPRDADLVFDVRFLPNPFYIDALKEHNGTEECVRDFVMKYDQSREFLTKLDDMLTMLIPHYMEEGKSELVIAIGCTGGRHRSVAIAEAIHKKLSAKSFNSIIRHRDMIKG